MAKASLPKASHRSTDALVYDATKHRLEAYDVFSAQAIEAVALVAQKQAHYAHYTDFFNEVGVPIPRLYVTTKHKGVPVVDIPAKQRTQSGVKQRTQQGTIVVHLPMANPLDQNQLYHIATIAATLPAYRVIAFGNPSGAPYRYRQQGGGFLTLLAIAFTHHRKALVAAEIGYLREHGIKAAHHAGYSYGAHKVLIESGYLDDDEVASLTLVDPVAHPRGIQQLIHDFKATFAPMGRYVNRTKLPSYFEARKDASQTNHHKAALYRPISLAIGVLMARFDLMPAIRQVLTQHRRLRLTVAWGSRSELGNDAHMRTSIQQLMHDRPEHIKALRLKDDEHALANDIHLYAAIVYTGVNG